MLAQQQAQYIAAQEAAVPPSVKTAAPIATAPAAAAVPAEVSTSEASPAPAKREASATAEAPVTKKAKVADEPAPAPANPPIAKSVATQAPVAAPAASVVAPAPAAAAQPAPPASASAQPNTDFQTRDREHSTVFVVGPSGCGMTDAALAALFRDCGAIRESKVKAFEQEGREVGMVEFAETDAVGAARTKDKKKFKGGRNELSVFEGVGSCLYVTNFPEEFDKERLEGLFRPVSPASVVK